MSKPPATLRAAKKDRTRGQLLQSALQLIEERGFEQATVADIAAAAEVSPRTLLRYFPTKEDVIVSWVEDGMSRLRDELAARMPIADPSRALMDAARVMLGGYGEQARFFMTIERVIASNPSVSARKEQMVADLAHQASVILSDERNTKPLSPIVAEALAGTVFALVRASIKAWLADGGDVPILDLFDKVSGNISFNA